MRLAYDAFGGDAVDRNGHGTHCAGTIGGATVGVAKNVNLYSVKVLSDDGSGTTTTVINGINFAARQTLPNKILSMSLGGGVSTALNNASQRGIDGNLPRARGGCSGQRKPERLQHQPRYGVGFPPTEVHVAQCLLQLPQSSCLCWKPLAGQHWVQFVWS